MSMVLSWAVLLAALVLFRRRPPELRGILLLDRRFEEGQFVSFSVHTALDEILDASQKFRPSARKTNWTRSGPC